MEKLPEECLSLVISFTSPRDACRAAAVSEAFRIAADSDATWAEFLPSDCREIISRSASPVEFSSKKELFFKLCSAPLLIDGGTKTFAVDRASGKKCYMLGARALSISWSAVSYCWCWKPLVSSRFPIGVELIMVSWLQVGGGISARTLSPDTSYGVYLVFQVASRAFGLEELPMVAELRAGNFVARKTIDVVKRNGKEARGLVSEEWWPCRREDGWMEVEIGEFCTGRGDMEVEMEFGETKGEQLKGGLVLEGIEVRPKQ